MSIDVVYRVRMEEIHVLDGREVVVRSVDERRQYRRELDDSDGEFTLARLMATAASTLCLDFSPMMFLTKFCFYYAAFNETNSLDPWRRIQELYDKWNPYHDFHECVDVSGNEKLDLDANSVGEE